MEGEIQRLAVDANLHDMFGVENAYAVGASKLRAELREVVEFLKGLTPYGHGGAVPVRKTE